MAHPKSRTAKDTSEDVLVYTVVEAGRLLGLSRTSAYLAAKAGSLPVVRIRGKLIVPKVALHRMLDSTATNTSENCRGTI